MQLLQLRLDNIGHSFLKAIDNKKELYMTMLQIYLQELEDLPTTIRASVDEELKQG